ncbi:hypothetical protein ASPZODRAFT_416978 [Penicilliopsis zonata CBS 506.65]|uniref:Uncharacterized protein n=1 Tax=Penicilliopsis zonata CBS 506.65 TaxID=1073090 RepID=A0A1L9SWQ9_9EURO|nr:hypothetical protein ASPZODRAFT_416978 [Penicilliopsis zonata CBS 506.65]OJJ51557.1 hypothetical protein ASPZODRAFT_416978 [Penicilliopsis zonata CBS 506.65]
MHMPTGITASSPSSPVSHPPTTRPCKSSFFLADCRRETQGCSGPYGAHHPSRPPSTGRRVKLFDGLTDRIIKSGDIITFRTDDPDNHPLPSYELLEVQCFLYRIAAIRGAADDDDDEEEEEEEEEESKRRSNRKTVR